MQRSPVAARFGPQVKFLGGVEENAAHATAARIRLIALTPPSCLANHIGLVADITGSSKRGREVIARLYRIGGVVLTANVEHENPGEPTI